MYRVYKDFLRRVLLVLIYHRDMGYEVSHAISNARDNWRDRRNSPFDEPKTQDALNNVFEAIDWQGKNGAQISALIRDCVAELNSVAEGQDRDLIDTIVRTIGLPYARNALAGSTLQRLRDAILLPEEVLDLRKSLETETACANCGHKFLPYEMSVYVSRGDIHQRGFNCIRCTKPNFLANDSNIALSVPVSEVKGLMACLKRPSPVQAKPEPAEVLGMLDEIAGAPVAPQEEPIWQMNPMEPPAADAARRLQNAANLYAGLNRNERQYRQVFYENDPPPAPARALDLDRMRGLVNPRDGNEPG